MKKRKKSSRFRDRIKKGENKSCLGIIKASPDPLSDAMLATHEHCDPSALGSKNARHSKVNEDSDQLNPTHEQLLQQLELQRQVVEAHCSEPQSQSVTSLEIPDLNISSQRSSVTNTLHNARDQMASASMTSHCTLQEMAAHGLMQATAALTHQLTLQRAKWEKEQRGLSDEIKQLKREKEEAEVKAKRKASEFKDWSEKAERLLLKCKSEIERLEQGCEDSFNAGRAAGRLEVAESEEYQAAIRKARLSGAKDCLSSRMFELRWAAKVAEHEVIGFKKCQKQVLKLGGFKKGFNLGLLDSAMDGNLEVVENADGDELESGSVGEEMEGC